MIILVANAHPGALFQSTYNIPSSLYRNMLEYNNCAITFTSLMLERSLSHGFKDRTGARLFSCTYLYDSLTVNEISNHVLRNSLFLNMYAPRIEYRVPLVQFIEFRLSSWFFFSWHTHVSRLKGLDNCKFLKKSFFYWLKKSFEPPRIRDERSHTRPKSSSLKFRAITQALRTAPKRLPAINR